MILLNLKLFLWNSYRTGAPQKIKTPRKSPEKWTFLSLAFYNAPILHSIDLDQKPHFFFPHTGRKREFFFCQQKPHFRCGALKKKRGILTESSLFQDEVKLGFLDPKTLLSRKWGFGPLYGVGGIQCVCAKMGRFAYFLRVSIRLPSGPTARAPL